MNCKTINTVSLVQAPKSQGLANVGSVRGCALRGHVASRSAAFKPCQRKNTVAVNASSEERPKLLQRVAAGLAGFGLSTMLSLGAVDQPAVAGEFDILNDDIPQAFIIDDANVLSRAAQGALVKELKALKAESGYELDVVTVRKLVFEPDPFAFADQVIEHWYPTIEEGNNKGVFVLVTTSKEGALVGGPAFLGAVGDDLIDSLVTDNIPILGGEEKFNEATLSSVRRISAVITGAPDPGPPVRQAKQTGSNYKTKDETLASRNKFAGVVVGLLVIATAVPMIQYYGYTNEE